MNAMVAALKAFIGRCLVVGMSESQVDREPERPARRERSYIDVSRDRLIPEIADFGIEAGVVGECQQVSPAETQLHGAETATKAGYQPLRNVVGERHFAELREARVLHVDRRLIWPHSEAICSLRGLLAVHGDRVGVVGRVRPEIVEKLRERSEEHTSELQSPCNLVCRLLREKKKKDNKQESDTNSEKR